MKNITSRNFSILCDFMDVYQFMIDIYEKIGGMVFRHHFWSMHLSVIGWINPRYTASKYGRTVVSWWDSFLRKSDK